MTLTHTPALAGSCTDTQPFLVTAFHELQNRTKASWILMVKFVHLESFEGHARWSLEKIYQRAYTKVEIHGILFSKAFGELFLGFG